MTIKQIATHLLVNHNTVGNWIMAWEELGIAGLYRKTRQGRVPILTVTSSIHVEALANAVKDNAQNVKIVQAELIEVLKTPMSADTVKRFLKKIVIPGRTGAPGAPAVVPTRRRTN